MPTPTTDSLRLHYPSLGQPVRFLDNAGGSQVPIQVINAIRHYFTDSCAQTGAAYTTSTAAAATIARAHATVKSFLNAHALGEVAIAQSTSALVHTLANAYADALHNGTISRRRIIVSTLGHEANIWPWFRLAARGFEVIPWHPIRSSSSESENLWTLDHAALNGLLDERTLLVAFPHVSNIMGQVEDARSICDRATTVGARSLVDGVAYAPHRAPDVAALGCDWYVYSTYKVFGPHAAAAFGSHSAFAEIDGPNHYFLPRTLIPYTFELGGVPHESAAGIAALDTYLHEALNLPLSAPTDIPNRRAVYTQAFQAFETIEEALQVRLLNGLASTPRIIIDGSSQGGPQRICTVSFHIRGVPSASISAALNARGIGIKSGNFYSRRLIERMGLNPSDGVVRISLAHYNTTEDVDITIRALQAFLHSA